MLRRNFVKAIACSPLAWPAISSAEQARNAPWRIAHVYPGKYDNPSDLALYDVFRGELRKLGYAEGRNLIIDQRSADGMLERLPSFYEELIALRPDVIVAITTPAIAAAQKATSSIPIVMAPATDPIGSGFIKSYARPGGNITGMTNMNGDALGKAVELLHDIVPSAKRVAVLLSNNPTHPQQYDLAEAAISRLNLTAVRVVAPTPADLEQAFEVMKRENSDALFVLADVTRPSIVTLAAKSRIPTIYQTAVYAPMGGLASYSPALDAIYQKVAQYCDRIFKGAKPAELPVEQPVTFELALNLQTATAFGITFPDRLIARADKLIE
jgi:putative ABC transport system substrate-binding protein